ncbi:MAG: hypothetical protein C4518_10680 [Desulfobacteraceae bacterium]|nr:MAG: hypothetical protein C4518_10680 [Desulfobacteraceae bacterium]
MKPDGKAYHLIRQAASKNWINTDRWDQIRENKIFLMNQMVVFIMISRFIIMPIERMLTRFSSPENLDRDSIKTPPGPTNDFF